MKTNKNLALVLLVTAIAIGASYVSYSKGKAVPTTYYVVATANGTTYTCQPVTVDPAICDLSGMAACRILVETSTSPFSRNVLAHPDATSCASVITDSTPANGGPYALDNIDAVDAKDSF